MLRCNHQSNCGYSTPLFCASFLLLFFFSVSVHICNRHTLRKFVFLCLFSTVTTLKTCINPCMCGYVFVQRCVCGNNSKVRSWQYNIIILQVKLYQSERVHSEGQSTFTLFRIISSSLEHQRKSL